MLSTSCCTFAIVLSLKTASDCSLTYFRPFQKLSCSGPTWTKWSPQKITFECSFIAQNPFLTILGLKKNFGFFFSKIQDFYVLTPILPRWGKVNSPKNHIWVLFYRVKSISDHFRTLKNFEKFFKNLSFFVLTPILLRWKKWSQQKIIFECSFIAQNPFHAISGLWKILKIFRNILKFLPPLARQNELSSQTQMLQFTWICKLMKIVKVY